MKKLKKVLLSFVIVFTFVSFVAPASAYFDDSNSGIFLDNSSTSISIGEWKKIFAWDPNLTYHKGDQVTHKNHTYEARRTTNQEPGSGWWWWFYWSRL